MAAPDAPAPLARIIDRGETVGRFVLLGLLGRGGMGEVYAAYDPELDRKVAVKILLRGRSADGEARLLREAQAIAKLQHPNVVVVYDVGRFRDTVFIAMEFIDGQTLGYWLHAERRPWRETLRIFQAAGRGLEAAHGLGMVHRDFKPDNVMLTRDGQVRVMDFGLARQVGEGDGDGAGAGAGPTGVAAAAPPREVDPDATMPVPSRVMPVNLQTSERYLELKLTQTGAQIGTPAYMAPEQFLAKRSDARSDQFSFCVALYEALYGERPFAGDTMPALMSSVLEGRVRPTPEKARVPGWIRRVVLRGLATDPGARYPSMKALLEALDQDPSARRRTWALAALGAAGAAGIALAASHVGAGKSALCAGGAAKFAGVWEAGGAPSARKEAIRAAFVGGGKSYAADTFAGAARLLDDYVARWTTMYRDACEATSVRGEQSADVLDLRMACLNERLGNLRALTDVFTKADDGVVQNAVGAAGNLPPLDGCADVAALRAVVKPPQDPAARKRVEELREEVARVTALKDSGQCGPAAARSATLVEAVKATGYAPLLAKALYLEGRLGDYCSDPAAGVQHLKEAFGAAVAGHEDALAIETASCIALLAGDRLGDGPRAHDWALVARSMLDRGGFGPVTTAPVLDAEGTVLFVDGDANGRVAKMRESHALTVAAIGADHPIALGGLMNIGDALAMAGRYEEALAADREALAAAERVYGRVHMIVAADANNLCEALNHLARFAEARAACAKALSIWREIGAEPIMMAYGNTGLGLALLGEGRPAEAVAPLEAAIAARQPAKLAPRFLGEPRFALARALAAKPETRARALAMARQARTDYGTDAKEVAEIDAWLAKAR
jgi:tetratricopeptide (TPR) repeat protein